MLGRAQRIAAVLLLLLFAECLYTIAHQPLDANDYRYARCGREMWERPSPLQGYFTTCGNLNGDGTLAYRLAGFPLSAQRFVLLGVDHLRKPENRLYSEGSLNGTTWEARHELSYVKYLMRLPFVLFAVWLGGGLWWVSRRLFGNEGGAIALGLYVLCPEVVRYATHPNNEVLALWGLYGLVYTAIGVAHALQGPRTKWKPRILLLATALGLTAAAHLLAAIIGFIAGLVFLYYLADRRRSNVAQIMIFAALGAFVILFASFSFRPSAFMYVFTGGSARFWFTTEGVARFCSSPAECRASWLRRRSRWWFMQQPPEPVLWQHDAADYGAGAVSDLHDAGGERAVGVGAAVPLYVHRRCVCRHPGEPPAEAVSYAQRRYPDDPGGALLDDLAGLTL